MTLFFFQNILERFCVKYKKNVGYSLCIEPKTANKAEAVVWFFSVYWKCKCADCT